MSIRASGLSPQATTPSVPLPRIAENGGSRKRTAAVHAAMASQVSRMVRACAASSSRISSGGISVSHSISVGLGPKRAMAAR